MRQQWAPWVAAGSREGEHHRGEGAGGRGLGAKRLPGMAGGGGTQRGLGAGAPGPREEQCCADLEGVQLEG